MTLTVADPAAVRYDRFISRRFHTVVMQPTTYCPWACDYCYLPGKDKRMAMPTSIAAAVASSIATQHSPHPVEVVWHGGEPLAAGLEAFTALLTPFEHLRLSGRVRHAVQTNAGLITAGWCEVLARYGFTVGVSIDGPEWATTQRRDRAGRSAFSRIMRGIDQLRAHEIVFSAIAVITPESIGRAEEIAEFFETLGATSVGFNLEEHEGANTQRPGIDPGAARAFWRELIRRRAEGSGLRVRELDRILGYLCAARADSAPTVALHEPIPTVAWNGQTVILSPELAGIHAPEYGDFVLGNVADEPLDAMLARAHQARYVQEFTLSLGACAQSCEFYDFCLGAQAGNRYFEHGDFTTTETSYCRASRQALVHALNDHITKETR